MIVAACEPLSVSSLSKLLKLSEDEVHAILEPISCIIDHPLRSTKDVKFYHATAKEFITGSPIGNENDQVFFITDVEGYSLGLPLLQLSIIFVGRIGSACRQHLH
jgi:hypothetical protein